MFSDLLAAAKALASGITWMHQLREQDRKRFAQNCENISRVLQQYAEASWERRQAISLCAELREYVKPIREVAPGALPAAEIDRVAGALNGVCDAWDRRDRAGGAEAHAGAHDLDQIIETAGTFRGLANRLRGA
jgi:hypothetical protein